VSGLRHARDACPARSAGKVEGVKKGPNLAAVERAARRLLGHLFSGECDLVMNMTRDQQGGEALHCTWKAGGWEGRLTDEGPGAV
jgi:hypothetical protein